MMQVLHSQIFGEGTPFLILHGFLGMSDNWKTMGMQYAAQGFQLHLLDLRNHGHSFHSEDFSYEVMDTGRICLYGIPWFGKCYCSWAFNGR